MTDIMKVQFMARTQDKERARRLRAQGKSYSEIKEILHINKSTLSGWLYDMPLSATQLRQLRDKNPKRIEHFRETMKLKRESRLRAVYEVIGKKIGNLSDRDIFLTGFYLYWGEGLKAARGVVGIANTDPAVIAAFLSWSRVLGLERTAAKVRLHLYSDMNISEATNYWSKILDIPISQFRKPYIKTSKLSDITYKNGFGHGTCNVTFANMPMWEYITMALKRLRELHTRP